MSKIFIYYSLTGNGEEVSKTFAEKGYDIVKLEPKKDIPNKGFMKYFYGGYMATFYKKLALKKDTFDLNKYDQIVIGSPVWNGRPSPVFNMFMYKNKFDYSKAVVLAYSGGGNSPKFKKRVENKYENIKYVEVKQPKKYREEALAILNQEIFTK